MADGSKNAFMALLRAGLWETEVQLASIGDIDYECILRLAREQSVVGVVALGLEHVSGVKVPQSYALQFAGETIQMEQRNKAMNVYIAKLVEEMRSADIYTLLVKGQGLAQCYIKPLWRTCGDIDFFMSEDNYRKAKELLIPQSFDNKQERQYSKELGLSIDQWFVELHGTQRTGLSSRLDNSIDALQKSLFFDGKVRSWMNDKTQVFLPAVDEDVLIVFTHFLKHFYKGEGVSLRQICDWCRLLYTYRKDLNSRLLESRLSKMHLMTEWIVFGIVAVKYLGMPKDAMPFYTESRLFNNKADKIVNNLLYRRIIGGFQAFLSAIQIFPFNSLRFLLGILFDINLLKIKEYYSKFFLYG